MVTTGAPSGFSQPSLLSTVSVLTPFTCMQHFNAADRKHGIDALGDHVEIADVRLCLLPQSKGHPLQW
jgi:hypothetical protein